MAILYMNSVPILNFCFKIFHSFSYVVNHIFRSESFFLFHLLQGTTVRVEFGDTTIAADPADDHAIRQAFPHTSGQPLAHFLRATANVPDAQIIEEHPAIRSILVC